MGVPMAKQQLIMIIASLFALCAYAAAGTCTTWGAGLKGTTVTCKAGYKCTAYCLTTTSTICAQQCNNDFCKNGGIGNGKCKTRTVTSSGKTQTVKAYCSDTDISNGTVSPNATITAVSCPTWSSASSMASISLW